MKKIVAVVGMLGGLMFAGQVFGQQDYWQQAAEQQRNMQEQQQAQDRQNQEQSKYNPLTACSNGRDLYGYIGDAACGGGNNNSNAGSNSSSNQGGGSHRPPVIVDMWGAVALNAKTGSFGYAQNQSTRGDAEAAAVEDCNDNCSIIGQYKNQCAAYAWGKLTNGFGFSRLGFNINKSVAEKKALAACGAKAKKCEIVMSECSKL